MIRVIFVFGVGAIITGLVDQATGVANGPLGLIIYAGVCVFLINGTSGRNNGQGGGR